MDDMTTTRSPLRRWLVSLLIWYIILMIVYLGARFLWVSDWTPFLLLHNLAPYLFLPALVGWVIAWLLRSLRLVGVYSLLVLVGALWIGGTIAPPIGKTTPTGTAIDVLTFNIYPDNPRLDEAVQWIIAHDPDIVAVQEIPQDDDIRLAPFYAHYPYAASQGIRETQAVFSRYPILSVEALQLGPSVHQRLLLDIAGQEVALYNVHLHVPYTEGDTWLPLRYDETIRNQQIAALVAHIKTENLPLLIMGDFNMTEWSPIYRDLRAVMHDAYREATWGIGATWPGDPADDLQEMYPRVLRLDYVWYSDHFAVRDAVVGAYLGSDHLPLMVEIAQP